MARPEQEAELRELARFLKVALREIYGEEMGFFLNIARFSENEREGEENVSDYISNAKRETCIEWMRETIERFTRNEDIPASKGEA